MVNYKENQVPIRSPKEEYAALIAQSKLDKDKEQAKVIDALQRIYDEIVQIESLPLWKKAIKALVNFQTTKTVKGLYLWGGVGRGKTYLMDIFYHALPIKNKLRMHFHHFMKMIHNELNIHKGTQDPLIKIATLMAKKYQVICFDEFFVSDITDAMLLGNLFAALFENNVTLIATSNIAPDELYKNGLQRARFLPAIDLINQHCQVHYLSAGNDYRLRTLENADIFHSPLDERAEKNLQSYFCQLTQQSRIENTKKQILDIDGRQLVIIQQAAGVLFISFRQLCDGPRSQRDYMEIASQFHTVIISKVEQMGTELIGDDIARRFLAVIDEFYDRQVKLIISAQTDVEHLYKNGLLSFEFTRCCSRLIEMQSKQYLALPHHP